MSFWQFMVSDPTGQILAAIIWYLIAASVVQQHGPNYPDSPAETRIMRVLLWLTSPASFPLWAVACFVSPNEKKSG